ncbi:MAG: MFS transporter [Tepidisphaerales bacterium]
MTTSVSQPAAKLIGLRLAIMMFLQFFVWGAWYVSVGNYMTAHGMTSGIKWAYTVGPLAALISPFFLGMIADRFFATEKILGILHLIGGAAMMAAPMFGKGTPSSHWPFVAMLLVHMLCYMPTLGLTNTISFANMYSPEKQFPMIRVFGTIGWIVAGWVVGLAASRLLPIGLDLKDTAAVEAATKSLSHFLLVGGGAGILLGLYSFSLPHTPPPAAGKPFSVRDALGLDSLALLKSPSFLVFVICSFLICIPLAAYYNWAPVFASAAGIASDKVPILMSFGQFSEIFFMLIMPLCFAKLGVKWMLAAGMFAWALRYTLFAGAPGSGAWELARLVSSTGGSSSIVAPWLPYALVLGGIVLHGICYDFFFVTGFIYVDKKAPAKIRGQAQGFLVLITQGLGLGIGAQLVGAVVAACTSPLTDKLGQPVLDAVTKDPMKVINWFQVWSLASISAIVIMVLFLLLFRNDAESKASEQK